MFAAGLIVGIAYGWNSPVQGLSPSKADSLDIIFNNLAVGGILIVSGWITAGVISSLFLAFNGFTVGVVVGHVAVGYGLTPIYRGLLPHFFVELLALLLCAVLGLFSAQILWRLAKRQSFAVSEYIRDGLLLAASALLLFTFAGLIEGHISEVVLNQ